MSYLLNLWSVRERWFFLTKQFCTTWHRKSPPVPSPLQWNQRFSYLVPLKWPYSHFRGTKFFYCSCCNPVFKEIICVEVIGSVEFVILLFFYTSLWYMLSSPCVMLEDERVPPSWSQHQNMWGYLQSENDKWLVHWKKPGWTLALPCNIIIGLNLHSLLTHH